ncbi:hypothetical protein PPERSA_01363 [Pseudocohnilembus persalinus]|uniref:Sperm-tail PG-rich repeat n=1 Tax=Pseudocohnilembus persalinus TaxID=266149 RepID=A0A0V0QH21_PSEPJ|nr:hypothetical protein PPERSA_01363 [Pseudocohnilembus persalinus]|eukprot:KRX01460.1 hypothetical protein PPERSA_01363 [Pseudocohnilembus persalinus]
MSSLRGSQYGKSMFSCTSPQEILNHQLNDSKAKFHYSFSQAPRFNVKKSYSNTDFYESQNQFSSVGPKFGKEERVNFTQNQSNYTAAIDNQYKSEIEQNLIKQRGYTFGESRDKVQNNGHIEVQKLQNPGVGNYNLSPSPNKKKGYTMRPRTANPNLPITLGGKSSSYQNPGPGQYSQEDAINGEGKTVNSKYKSQQAKSFGPVTASRFLKNNNRNPGVGTYALNSTLKKNGCSFGSQARISFTDQVAKKNNNPGIGSYRMPSDFGHYDQASGPYNSRYPGSQLNKTRSYY